MFKVEILPVNSAPYIVQGETLEYKEEYGCYYIAGQSFPKSIVGRIWREGESNV